MSDVCLCCERPRFAVRRLNYGGAGLRYWAFERHTMRDAELGLRADGYGTEAEAWEAIGAVEGGSRG